MKIGILTFHREVNDGSTLQCYCLYRLLTELVPDSAVEVIDYLPAHVRKRRRSYLCVKRPPFILSTGNRPKRRAQDRFLDEHVRMSPAITVDDSVDSARQAILGRRYDAIVVGSDTVWDTRPSTGAPKVPNIFTLPGLSDVRRISFAASMDKGGPRHVSHELWQKMIDEIGAFDFISIRDQTTEKWLVDGGLPPDLIHFLPDPTLLFDFSTMAKAPNSFLESHPRLAAVAVSNPRLQQEATRQLADLGYQVVNLLCSPVEGQIPIPADWTYGERLGLHGHFEFLITDRFHASIFALKQKPEMPVLFVEPDYFYPEKNSKGRDLFERLGSPDSVWRYRSDHEIPARLIAETLQEHALNPPDVRRHIYDLVDQARSTIRTMANLLL